MCDDGLQIVRSPIFMPVDMPALAIDLLRTRAREQLCRSVLHVNYYRIRYRLAFELPIRELPKVELPVRGIPIYPWGTWLLWAWEERLSVLGWSAQHEGNARATELLNEEIAALAQWPRYEQYKAPDLVMGHLVRALSVAARRPVLLPEVRQLMSQACRSILEKFLHWSEGRYGSFTAVAQVIEAADKDLSLLANIPLIGQTALCMAARLCRHDATESLDRRMALLYQAVLERHKTGVTEGVIYDGYVLDFIADWLADQAESQALTQSWDMRVLSGLAHPNLALSAPGHALELAPLGDVEPRDMPFYLSAFVKLACPQNGHTTWDQDLLKLDWNVMRSDALEAIASPVRRVPVALVRPHAPLSNGDSPYLIALRTGSDDEALSVCIGLPRTHFGHLHCDTGSLVIGAAGHWIITDPGYQQYLATSERQFTIGPQAHNAPVVNGHHQTLRRGQLLKLTPGPDRAGPSMMARIDMTSCYVEESRIRRAVRTVWLHDRRLVVVRDDIETLSPHDVAYTWHGDPLASWLVNMPVPAIVVGAPSGHDEKLWIQARNIEIAARNIHRLRGSRGSLSLTAHVHSESHHASYWWVFDRGERPSEIMATSSTRIELRRNQTIVEISD